VKPGYSMLIDLASWPELADSVRLGNRIINNYPTSGGNYIEYSVNYLGEVTIYDTTQNSGNWFDLTFNSTEIADTSTVLVQVQDVTYGSKDYLMTRINNRWERPVLVTPGQNVRLRIAVNGAGQFYRARFEATELQHLILVADKHYFMFQTTDAGVVSQGIDNRVVSIGTGGG
ncbi:MAG: hypothetical protein NUV82_00295, partial [Candidatus Komeilibacteria bacterium]|nr:hypothetical protein [Candidatus Komeilibacteria bacterium]